jgi:acyl-CoA synthetase (AMP-forming)/AMP-acid ligase II
MSSYAISCRNNVRVTETEIREFCRDKISRQKIPQHIRFVTAFPMTGSGKVQKHVMRERMTRELQRLARAAAPDGCGDREVDVAPDQGPPL